MITTKARTPAGNTRHSNGHSASTDELRTHVSYFSSLRETVVEQFCSNPFRLSRREAEKCAEKVMEVVERSPRHVTAG
jgi:dihydroneopterin aldolase